MREDRQESQELDARNAYPGPMAAFLLTLAATVSFFFVAALFANESPLASVGIGLALGFGGIATLAARRVPEPQADRLGLISFSSRFLGPLLLLLPAVLVVSELENILSVIFPAPDLPIDPERAEELAKLVEIDSLYGFSQMFIITAGIAPVVEEWLFRGVIQQGLVARLGRGAGVLATAALFAPVHLFTSSLGSPVAATAVALTLGVLFGTLRLATGSILAPMLLSSGISAVALFATRFSEAVPIAGFNVPGEHTSLGIVLFALITVVIGLTPVVRAAREAPTWFEIPPESATEPDEDGPGFF